MVGMRVSLKCQEKSAKFGQWPGTWAYRLPSNTAMKTSSLSQGACCPFPIFRSSEVHMVNSPPKHNFLQGISTVAKFVAYIPTFYDELYLAFYLTYHLTLNRFSGILFEQNFWHSCDILSGILSGTVFRYSTPQRGGNFAMSGVGSRWLSAWLASRGGGGGRGRRRSDQDVLLKSRSHHLAAWQVNHPLSLVCGRDICEYPNMKSSVSVCMYI